MSEPSAAAVTASDWIKGIALSVTASVIGGASKLAIRKSWLMVENLRGENDERIVSDDDDDEAESSGENDCLEEEEDVDGEMKRKRIIFRRRVMPPSTSEDGFVDNPSVLFTPYTFVPSTSSSSEVELTPPGRASEKEGRKVQERNAKKNLFGYQNSSHDICNSSNSESSSSSSSSDDSIIVTTPSSSRLTNRLTLDDTKNEKNRYTPPSTHAAQHLPVESTLLSLSPSPQVPEGPSTPKTPISPQTSSSLPSAATVQMHDHEQRRIKRTAGLLRFMGMIGMTFLNPLCCVFAMNYASPSILAPFSGLTLVWIVIFSDCLIEERPSNTQIVAATLIVLGEVIVAVFGDHTNDVGVTIEDVRISYRDPYFILYFICMAFWMGLLSWMMTSGPNSTTRRFAWGVSGGSITGLQNFLKDSLTIMKDVSASEGRLSFPWYFYAMVILAIVSSFVGLLLLTACMKRYDATYSAAMFVGSFVISASIMSAIHYQTFASLVHIWNYILYPVGLFVLMTGVVLLIVETHEDDVPDVSDEMSGTECTVAARDNEKKRRNSFEMKIPLVPPDIRLPVQLGGHTA